MALAMGPAEAPALRDLIWTEAGPQRAHVLTHAPAECLAAARDDAAQREIEAGRALFRSRTLLGGPAARVGLSCESCHANGRRNEHFLLPELTDRAGFADVTSSWSSKVRGDGINNPVRIPDLAGVGTRTTFGSHGETSLERFVHSVVVEEFQGAAPPAAAMTALLAYLRALEVCDAPEARVTMASLGEDARRAVRAAGTARDDGTARLLRLAAQDAIARIVERLPARRFVQERQALEVLSRDLAGGANESWNARFDVVMRRIMRRERATYAHEATLASALR